jgi:hypothetical protein
MEVELEHEGHEHKSKRIGIVIAVMAGILAIVEAGGHKAATDVVRETVEASDTWAFYQAKSIRAAMFRADAKSLQLTAGASAPQGDVAKTVAEWNAAAAHEDSEPATGEGRKELNARAVALEKHRDDRNAAMETYELASGALELGILLASSSVVTGLIWLAYLGGGLGALGTVLGLLGWFAPHLLG